MAKKQTEYERDEAADDLKESQAASDLAARDGADASGGETPPDKKPEPTERECLEAELIAVQRECNALRRREAEIQASLDRIIRESERDAPVHSNQLQIQAYIQQQQQQRVARIERRNAILAAGIDPSELVTAKAPIDLAMARNRRRGGARPQFPAKTN